MIIKLDRFLCKNIQLKHSRLNKKLEHILQLSKNRKCVKRNIPIIINRWAKVKNFMKDLYKWDIDPAYAYKTMGAVPGDILDLSSGN